MKRLKEDILKDNQISNSFLTHKTASLTRSFTDNSAPSTWSSIGNSTTRSSDVYIYDVVAVPVLTTGAYLSFP